MRAAYLLPNPHDEYAVHLIQRLFFRHGLKPICIYTDEKVAHYLRPSFPILQSEIIRESFTAAPRDFGHLCLALKRRYRILGVIPVIEPCVEVAADLVEQLGHESWMPPATLRRFRDKYRMLSHLREHSPSIRIPLFTRVREPRDVFAAEGPAHRLLEADQVVLKPRRGYGNRQVAILRRDELTRDRVAKLLSSSPDEQWLLQEFVDGRELSINGQVGARKNVVVTSVTEYFRVSANGRRNVYDREVSVPSTDPLFGPLTAYASEVVLGLGLLNSPFHMEVKVDERGPCVIDLGARVVGNGLAFTLSRLHPKAPDMLEVAAHGCLFRDDLGLAAPVDFGHYDQHPFARVSGISLEEGLITRLEGVEEVEKLPEFARWSVKPTVGQRLVRTEDLFSLPWEVDLIGHGTREGLGKVANQVRQTIRWNQGVMGRRERAIAHATYLSRKAAPKLSWLLHRAKRKLGAGERQEASLRAPLSPDVEARTAIRANNRVWEAAFYDEVLVTTRYELVSSRFSSTKFLSSAHNVHVTLEDAEVRHIERHYRMRGRPASLFLQPDNWAPLSARLLNLGYREAPEDEEVWLRRSLDAGGAPDVPLVELVPCERSADFDLYLSLAVTAFSTRLFDYRPWAERLRERWRRAPEGVDLLHYVAKVGDDPVGVAALGLNVQKAFLFNAAILPRFRGQGLQKAMMQRRLELARERGANVAYFQSDAANHASIAAGRALGFHECFRRRLLFKPR